MTSPYGDLVMTSYERVVGLRDGMRFPERVTATLLPPGASSAIELTFEVRDDRAELMAFSVIAVDRPLSPAAIHDLPVAALADEAVRRIAVVVAVQEAVQEARATGQSFDVDPDDVAERAVASLRRGRPLTDALLAQVAEIVKNNPYSYRQEVHLRLHTSQRTASRWIAEARRRGLIEEGDD